MDREPDELQFIGFYGVYKEAYKIIFSWPKIFTQITLAFILPLSFIILAQLQISELVFVKFLYSQVTFYYRRTRISDWLPLNRITFWVFEAGYLLFAFVLFLLSASAVVYTIACIYTTTDLTFAKVLSVVPKVWKRLTITLLLKFSIKFVTLVPTLLILLPLGNHVVERVLFVFLSIFYTGIFVCININWELATVVSVLEDRYGFQAMNKSKELTEGKMGVACAIYISNQLSIFVILYVFKRYVVNGPGSAWMSYGVGCFLVLTMLILLGLVVQTVVYFTCKSYHHESIDNLEVDSGDYVPLKGRDTQLELF